VFLPLVMGAGAQPACPVTSTNQYAAGPAIQYDLDNPVRPAANHADKNLALRGYAANDDPGVKHKLVNYGTDDPRAPQFATFFSPARVPTITGVFRVHDWNWAASPNPGTPGGVLTRFPVTAVGLRTTPGEPLRVPASDYDIGNGMEIIVLFADADSIALRYTREDSSGSSGYTLHVDDICPDPNLLALYTALDAPAGPRYVFVGRNAYSYDLPNLAAGQAFGTARGGELVLAIADSGTFMDPRSCNEWWLTRPGYEGICPPHESVSSAAPAP
jgi:hypothetical protein